MSVSDKLKAMFENKANENSKAGETFLAENGKKENVVTLPSGLQYEIIKQGDGPKPSANNTVTCHYHGTTIIGEVFDSSVKRGQPASFPLNAVIKGWTEALQLMPVGSKWKLYIPPHLAYGNRSISREIGPNSTLIFEVELISFR
jgi:FKBP-type peptidyl-prolyl cis-trans isomerase FklB